VYLEYWELNELPFENVPDPRFFYPSAEHQEALLRLFSSVDSKKGAAMLTGEAGCGKTILSRTLIQDLPLSKYEVGLIANPSLTPFEFLKEILSQLGADTKSESKVALLHALNSRVNNNLNAGKYTIVIIDEAQTINDPATLEELGLLLNSQINDRFPLTFLFIGQPELRKKIGSIEQLEQQISIKFHLGPLKPYETQLYIQTRLEKVSGHLTIFTEDAIKAIHRNAEGTPRLINKICDISLLLGFGSKAPNIGTDIVNKATSAIKQI